MEMCTYESGSLTKKNVYFLSWMYYMLHVTKLNDFSLTILYYKYNQYYNQDNQSSRLVHKTSAV